MLRMPGKVHFQFANGAMKGKAFVFDVHDTFIFGRAEDCHARHAEDDTLVSRHHFLVEVNPPAARRAPARLRACAPARLRACAPARPRQPQRHAGERPKDRRTKDGRDPRARAV